MSSNKIRLSVQNANHYSRRTAQHLDNATTALHRLLACVEEIDTEPDMSEWEWEILSEGLIPLEEALGRLEGLTKGWLSRREGTSTEPSDQSSTE